MTVHQEYLSLETALLARSSAVDDGTVQRARRAVLDRVGRCAGLPDGEAAAQVLAALGISAAAPAAARASGRGRSAPGAPPP